MGLGILITALIAAMAGGLVIFALRGRQIDNHPICRKCGFDLFGLSESTRCPECGTELSAKVIRVGHRAVRRGALAGGLVLLAPSAVVLMALALGAARNVDPNRYKPVWWLIREGDAAAVGELNRRLSAGSLSAPQIGRVVAVALAAQADLNRSFLVGWGDFVETARASGKVNDETWQRYAIAAVPLKLVARPAVRRGDPLPMQVQMGRYRLGSGRLLDALADVGHTSLADVPLRPGAGLGVDIKANDVSTIAIVMDGSAIAKLPDGPQLLRTNVSLTILERVGPRSGQKRKQLTATTMQLTTTINLVAEDQPTVQMVNDPALGRSLRGAIAIGARGARQVRIEQGWMDFAIIAVNPPTGVAFDVAVRDETGREWPMHTLVCPAGGRAEIAPSTMWSGFNADRVDVVMRPNRQLALQTVDVTRMWGETIILRDVPVVWDKAASRPMALDERFGRAASKPATMTPTRTPR